MIFGGSMKKEKRNFSFFSILAVIIVTNFLWLGVLSIFIFPEVEKVNKENKRISETLKDQEEFIKKVNIKIQQVETSQGN